MTQSSSSSRPRGHPKLLKALMTASLSVLYVYGIFFSDSGLYITVPDPHPLRNQTTTTSGNGRLKVLRTLPHLRAINTLAYHHHIGNPEENDEDSHLLDNEKPKLSNATKGTSNTTITEEEVKDSTAVSVSPILHAIFLLFMLSLSCRVLLALLIYRQTHRVYELEFDSNGQLQRRFRQSPIDQRISFWEAFRTIPMRNGERSNPNPNPTRVRLDPNHRLFVNMTNRLNEQRIANGARPLSANSMALLLSNSRDNFSGNDYEALWRIEEENGSGSGPALDEERGATEEEIAQCPVRFLEEGDELVHSNRLISDTSIGAGDDNVTQEDKRCAICLEDFEVGDMVRTIPCFHSFHANCIDPWLRQKGILCPVCKHRTAIN